jgi:hypothetical protein
MKLKMFLLAGFFIATALRADEKPDQLKSAAEIAPWTSKHELGHWERVLREKSEPAGVQLGKSDYIVSGPLVDALHRKKAPADRSLGRKLLGLPVVRLFVPQPMPSPPGGGKYFRWGESDRPWVDIASGAPGGNSNPVTHESRNNLFSVSTERRTPP